MEIKRQVEAKKLKYSENIISYSRRITSFSGLLLFMLSSYVEAKSIPPDALGGLQEFVPSDVTGGLQELVTPVVAGGIQESVPPIFGVINFGLLTISIVSLITTIIFAVKLRKLKKKNSLIATELNDKNATNVEEATTGDMLKQIKKKLVISVIVLVVSIITRYIFVIIYEKSRVLT